MRKLYADLVQETTATTGTLAVTLAQMTGWARFSDRFTVGDRVYYSIRNGSNWEVGFGTYSAANVLTRTTILGSLVAGTANWSTAVAITLAASSTVRAVAPENLFNQIAKVELSLISGPTTLADGFSYGVQASALTLTLPAAPAVNDRIQVFQAAAAITGTIINPNGAKINNVVGNMTIDISEFSLSLVYISAGYGWKVTP